MIDLTSGSLVESVRATLAELELSSADQAAASLAVRYAEALDSVDEDGELDGDLLQLGPKLLAALAELGASPRSRAQMRGGSTGGPSSSSTSSLGRIRAARAEREAAG